MQKQYPRSHVFLLVYLPVGERPAFLNKVQFDMASSFKIATFSVNSSTFPDTCFLCVFCFCFLVVVVFWRVGGYSLALN